MNSFTKKLEKILREDKQTVLAESEEAYGTHSPTQVKPEKGEEVTTSLDGSGKINATGPIPTNTAGTLKTTPGVSATEGPTGHIPTNSDLPRGQHDGLGTSNGPGRDSLPPKPKVYGLREEEEEDEKKKKLKEEEEDKKRLPPFMAKHKKNLKEEEDDKKLKEEKEKKLKEEKEEKSESEATKTLLGKSHGSGEKADHVKEETDEGEGDKTEHKIAKEEKEDEKADKKAVEEASAELLSGETISEALREKTATIFEATLSKRIKEYRAILNDRFTQKLNMRVETIREDLSEAVSGHLDIVVEHWIKENEVPLEKAIKAELVEDFISGLKGLFEEHYIELPPEKIDVVTEMVDRISKLENKLNEQIDTNANLQKQVKLHERTDVFEKVTKGMVATQVEKLRSLSENVEFKSNKQFEIALTTLKDEVTTQKKPAEAKKTLSEQTLEQSLEPSTGMMDTVTETLARMAKK
jgi:hypothetical protein